MLNLKRLLSCVLALVPLCCGASEIDVFAQQAREAAEVGEFTVVINNGVRERFLSFMSERVKSPVELKEVQESEGKCRVAIKCRHDIAYELTVVGTMMGGTFPRDNMAKLWESSSPYVASLIRNEMKERVTEAFVLESKDGESFAKEIQGLIPPGDLTIHQSTGPDGVTIEISATTRALEVVQALHALMLKPRLDGVPVAP
jgi:hypothetical protein